MPDWNKLAVLTYILTIVAVALVAFGIIADNQASLIGGVIAALAAVLTRDRVRSSTKR